MTLRSTLLALDRRTGGLLRKTYVSTAPKLFRAVGALVPGSRARRYCPCCDAGLIAWKKASFSRRPDLYDVRRYAGMPQDVVCPACGSIPRHRIIAWHLGQRPELLRGKKILHFAPERSLSLWLARRGLDVTTADLHRSVDLKLDLTDIDLPDGSYDAVICNHVLEHVDDYRRALSELHRILRPGGLLVISFPVDPRYETVREDASIVEPQDRVRHFGQHDHLRVFGIDSAGILENAGFDVEIARGADCPERIRPVTGPADYDSPDIFFCWKKQPGTQANENEEHDRLAPEPKAPHRRPIAAEAVERSSTPPDAPTQRATETTISIIVPIYNAEDTLERCVGSILAQTHADLDVILIDDGSTDISGAMCDAYAEFDPRVRAFHTPNRGLSAARNLGLDHALASSAQLIAFADADDWLEPDMLATLLETLETTQADIAQCGYFMDGLRTRRETRPLEATFTTHEALRALIDGPIESVVWNKLYRSRIFDTLRFPEGRVFEEHATTYRMLLRAERIACTPFVGYHYVMHEGSISHTTSMKNLADFWRAHKERYDYFVRNHPELLDERLENILARDAASAASRMWRWAFGCSAKERARYAGLLDEMASFVRNDLARYDKSDWPAYLKASLALTRSSSAPALATAYLANQLFIRTHPGKSWNRQ